MKCLRILMLDIEVRAFRDFVDKSSRLLEALEIRGPKNYFDLELTLNSMKNLPLLKILNFTTEICSDLKIADDPEMVLNDSVQELWLRLNSINSLSIIDGFFSNLSSIHISSTGNINMKMLSNNNFLPEFQNFKNVRTYEVLANYTAPSEPINLLALFQIFPNLQEVKISDCDCTGK